VYTALIYFEGPLSRRAGRIDLREVIWRRERRFFAFAIGQARGRARGLQRCRWAVLNEAGELLAGEAPRKSGLTEGGVL